MRRVVVIGSGSHHNTLGVIRALGMRGIRVETVLTMGTKNGFVAKSRYIAENHPIKSFSELEKVLMERTRTKDGLKDIIISCADEATEALNEHLDLYSERYIVPGVSEQGRMLWLMDKLEMKRIGEAVGLFFPEVYEKKECVENMKFPVITKAHVSSHGGKADIVICNTPDELKAYLEKTKDEVFIQRFIKKKEEVQFIGCSLRGGQEVIIPGMTRILRSQYNTNTGFLQYGPIEPFYNKTVEQCMEFLRKCGYSGLFSMEFLRDESDNVYFLEINFRNDGNAWCVTAAGVNLPMIWVKANTGQSFQDELSNPKTIMVMPEFQDFKLVIKHQLSLCKWIKDLHRTDAFLLWNKQDNKPFWYFIKNKIG